jgi:putative aldouronate transport system permease protein
MEKPTGTTYSGYRRGSNLKSYTRNWQLYMLLIPAVAFFLIFRYKPMYGVQIAFKNYLPTLGFAGSKWVGFKYFARFFDSYYAGRQIVNTFSVSLGVLLFSFPVPILIALTLNEVRNRRYKKIVQTVTYAPHFLSTVVIVGLIGSLTNIRYGLINNALMGLGIIDTAIPFASKAEWFRPLYIISDIWQESGWNAVIYMAALSTVDMQLYEAARVDGAGRLRCIWHVTIPWILPTMITMLILNSGKIMNIGYEKVLLMQNSLNIGTSDVITTYVYQQGLQNGQYSYATAIGLFNSVINTILIVGINTVARRVSETSLW